MDKDERIKELEGEIIRLEGILKEYQQALFAEIDMFNAVKPLIEMGLHKFIDDTR